MSARGGVFILTDSRTEEKKAIVDERRRMIFIESMLGGEMENDIY
jgi:hypothetical protein